MKKILFVLFALICSVSVYAQKQLTIDEAIKIALQKNPTLSKMKNNLTTSEAQVKGAYGALLPNFGAQTSFNWSRTVDKGVQLRDFFGNVTSTDEQTTESRYYNLQVGGNFTLFDGLANIANISQKKDNLKSAEYNISKIKQDIVYQTTDLFYLVLNAEELMKVREENVKYFQKFFETVNERNKLGSVAIADVYAAQVQLGNAELNLIQAQNQFETAKSNFLNYLALNVLEEYTLVDPLAKDKSIDTDSYMKNFDNIQNMVRLALDTRFDYKSQQSNVNAAENGVTIAQGGVLPQLTGNYGFSTSSTEPANLFKRNNYNIGLTLGIPIFSNFAVENQIQAAKIAEMNQKEDLLSLERQIKIEVKLGSNDLLAAKKTLDVAIKNSTYAEENRKINQERYNLGSATILEVLQANRDYIDAMRNKINSVYDFYRQYDKLNNAIGRLDFSKFE
jgi:outer membrane protein